MQPLLGEPQLLAKLLGCGPGQRSGGGEEFPATLAQKRHVLPTAQKPLCAACNNRTNNQLFAPATAAGPWRATRCQAWQAFVLACAPAAAASAGAAVVLALVQGWAVAALAVAAAAAAAAPTACWARVAVLATAAEPKPAWAVQPLGTEGCLGGSFGNKPNHVARGQCQEQAYVGHAQHNMALQALVAASDARSGVASQARPFGLPFGGPRHQPGWQYDPRIFRLGLGAVKARWWQHKATTPAGAGGSAGICAEFVS